MSSSEFTKKQTNQRSVTVIGDPALAAWEIVSVVSSILIAEWILSAVAELSKLIVAVPVALAFAFMFFSHRVRKETLRDLGFRFDNFVRAILLLLLPMLAVSILLVILRRWSGERMDFLRWHTGTPLIVRLVLGWGWGLAQQYVLQGFLNRRATNVLGRGWPSILLTAAIFAGLHLPNAWLVAVTFMGGLIWAAVYQRAPNLFALAVSHSLMTWVVVSTVPASALHHLRIGFSYFG